MTQMKIDLSKYRGNSSTIFTGRPQGTEAREELKLDELDKNEDLEIVLEIPEGTTSVNPSFYLGLLYPSYKKLGQEVMAHKYKFHLKDEDKETRRVLESNIEDGIRNAINELSRKTGLWKFIGNK